MVVYEIVKFNNYNINVKIIFMKRIIDRVARLWKYHKWLIIILVIAFSFYSTVSILKHVHFYSTAYDLSIFDQAVRGYSEFRSPESALRGYDNLLGDHFHPILVLLAPLYWINDSPVTLLLAQSALVCFTAIPIYLFAIKRLKSKKRALLIVVIFLFNAAIMRMVRFDFHEVAFALPAISWGLYAIYSKKWSIYVVSMIALLLTKEDLALLVVTFGLLLLLLHEYKKGAATIIAGLVSFAVIIKWAIPLFAGRQYRGYSYWSYSSLGGNFFEAVVYLITHPWKILTELLLPKVKILTMIKSIAPFLGLVFFSPIIVLAVPLVAERFYSDNSNYWEFTAHYGATLSVVLVFSLVEGLPRLKRLIRRHKRLSWRLVKSLGDGALCLMAFAAVVTAIVLPTRTEFPSYRIFTPSAYTLTSFEKSGYAAIKSVQNSDSVVCTTNNIAPHFQQRNTVLVDRNYMNLDCDYIVTSSGELEFNNTKEVKRAIVDECTRKKCSKVYDDMGWSVLRLY